MKKIFKVGRRHFDNARHGDQDAIRQLFDSRVQLWSDPNYVREIHPSRLFSDFHLKLENNTAFGLISYAVQIALQQETPPAFECGLWLIVILADFSRTTEMPVQLAEALAQLNAKCHEVGSIALKPLAELKRHYRIDD